MLQLFCWFWKSLGFTLSLRRLSDNTNYIYKHHQILTIECSHPVAAMKKSLCLACAFIADAVCHMTSPCALNTHMHAPACDDHMFKKRKTALKRRAKQMEPVVCKQETFTTFIRTLKTFFLTSAAAEQQSNMRAAAGSFTDTFPSLSPTELLNI